jgi:hypothetical protein
MKLSEAIATLSAKLSEEGDVNVFYGDMELMAESDFEVCKTLTDVHEEHSRYGEKYLYVGNR